MNNQPNIVIIIMDDLAWGDLACHGNPYTSTPNLDTLYGQSSHMTRYCSGPLCTPARASLMTGRYHQRTRAIDTYLGRSMIDPDEITLPQVLGDAGYVTGIFGKWHLGDCYPMRPIDMGFDTAVVHRGGGIAQPGDHPDNFGRESYFDPVLNIDGVNQRVEGYCTDIFADSAMAFIEKTRTENPEQPFFAYLATNAPHSPFQIADEWVQPYLEMGINETHARVYGMVENIDWNVGRVLDKLDALGIADDTVVIYTSDHGPCPSANDKTAPPDKRIRFNGGLRGLKGQMYEGGVRVPSFWRWNGHFAAGRDIDVITSPIDILPTLASISGASLPKQVDGNDLASLLNGASSLDADRNIFMQWHRGDEPVRYRNYAVITQQYKLYRPHEDQRDELYDILNDPFEQQDVASEHPDVVATLRTDYEQWFSDVSSTRPDNYAPPRIVIGTQHETTTTLTRQDWRIHGEDGWDDVHQGHWEIHNPQTADYQVEVRFSRRLDDGTVRLSFGNETFSQSFDGVNSVFQFHVPNLPEGDYQVEVHAQSSNVLVSPLYVIVTQK
jgi:arylsulfatase A-like enzyme